ncbi:BHLH domain-containing protein [Abeliophyllum distichum]|uniref:BHLH domain-containing protein n=1 Tax=Abeliophyllum distichum TaxID=126358 RepID=A0ABD1V394_9LAMI
MEFSILEELMAPRIENWASLPNEVNEVLPNVWSFSSFDQTQDFEMSNPSLLGHFSHRYPLYEPQMFLDNFTVPEFCSSNSCQNENPIPIQEDYTANLENEEFGFIDNASQRFRTRNQQL